MKKPTLFRLPSGVEWTMLWVEPGSFLMGSPANELGRKRQEGQHEVTLSRGFWLGETVVTKELWQAVLAKGTHWVPKMDVPMTHVSWEDCQEFLKRLNQLVEQLAFRLPFEAEWEYACRSGTTTAFAFGSQVEPHQVHCRFSPDQGVPSKPPSRPLPVRSLPPNPWGFREMHGNVWEICANGFEPYTDTPRSDPFDEGQERVKMVRGGAWFNQPEECRSAYRLTVATRHREDSVGFRLAAWDPSFAG